MPEKKKKGGGKVCGLWPVLEFLERASYAAITGAAGVVHPDVEVTAGVQHAAYGASSGGKR